MLERTKINPISIFMDLNSKDSRFTQGEKKEQEHYYF